MVDILGMDATQFQSAVLAWGAAVTTLIGVLVGLALAVRSALAQITAKTLDNSTAIAAVKVQTAAHENKLNGDFIPTVSAIVDNRISQHRRPGDNPPNPSGH